MTDLPQRLEPTPLPHAAGLDQRESKFLIDGALALPLWARACAELQPHDRDPERPVGYVRTTYFDTADHAYYRSAGAVARRLRVREYAAAVDDEATPVLTGVCVLELKHSAGGMRSKARLPIEPEELLDQLARFGEPQLQPVLTTWYRRSALSDDTGRLRVTLDQRVCFCAPTPIGTACEPAPRVLAEGPAFVLEVKSWEAVPGWLSSLLGGVPEAIGFSKFESGMRSVAARRAAARWLASVR
jgi:hypothetical protein